MQDPRIFSEIVIRSGGEADGLHGDIAPLGALDPILFSTYLLLLYAELKTYTVN